MSGYVCVARGPGLLTIRLRKWRQGSPKSGMDLVSLCTDALSLPHTHLPRQGLARVSSVFPGKLHGVL